MYECLHKQASPYFSVPLDHCKKRAPGGENWWAFVHLKSLKKLSACGMGAQACKRSITRIPSDFPGPIASANPRMARRVPRSNDVAAGDRMELTSTVAPPEGWYLIRCQVSPVGVHWLQIAEREALLPPHLCPPPLQPVFQVAPTPSVLCTPPMVFCQWDIRPNSPDRS